MTVFVIIDCSKLSESNLKLLSSSLFSFTKSFYKGIDIFPVTLGLKVTFIFINKSDLLDNTISNIVNNELPYDSEIDYCIISDSSKNKLINSVNFIYNKLKPNEDDWITFKDMSVDWDINSFEKLSELNILSKSVCSTKIFDLELNRIHNLK
jgi:hypothetical protein